MLDKSLFYLKLKLQKAILNKNKLKFKKKIKEDTLEFILKTMKKKVDHSWIFQNERYIKLFYHFFESMDQEILEKIILKKNLLFLKSNGKYGVNIYYREKANIILIFPDLMTLFDSPDPNYALAVLAHELGHIIHDHGLKKMDPMKAQLEADKFAKSLGLDKELLVLLDQYNHMEESKIRMKHLIHY